MMAANAESIESAWQHAWCVVLTDSQLEKTEGNFNDFS
jgi:hypothetical protein